MTRKPRQGVWSMRCTCKGCVQRLCARWCWAWPTFSSVCVTAKCWLSLVRPHTLLCWTERLTHTDKCSNTYKLRVRRETDRQTETDRQRQTETDRQRQTDRDRQRQTDRDRQIEWPMSSVCDRKHLIGYNWNAVRTGNKGRGKEEKKKKKYETTTTE